MMRGKIKIDLRYFVMACMLYYYIPCVTFILTWTKLYIAVLMTLCIAVSLVLVVKSIENDDSYNESFSVNVWLVFFVLVFCLGVGFISGWAGYGYQTEDWHKHNAILRDLLERPWPVIYKNNGETALLTYYIGQYLVPASVGKLMNLSFKGVLIINWLWSSIGLSLVCFLFIHLAKANNCRKQIFCILMIVLAGGLMPLQQSIGNALYPEVIRIGETGWRDYFLAHKEYMLQFRTNFISLRWVFAQTIVPWIIILLLFLNQKKVKLYVPLIIPSVLFGTFSAMSIIFIAILFFIQFCIEKKDFLKIIKNAFSAINVLSAASFGVGLFCYYIGYIVQPKPEGESFQFINFISKDIGIYFIFVLGSFGIYALLMLKEQKRNIAFWASVLIMSILPFFKFGVANDLLMGACIAPSMLLYLLIVQWLYSESNTLLNFKKGIMVTLLLIGFIKPAMEIYSLRSYDFSIYSPADGFITLESFADRYNEEIDLAVRYNYFTYDAHDSIFMKTIGKINE